MLIRIFDGGDVMLIMNLNYDYDDYVFPPLQASCGCLAQGNAQSGAHSCAGWSAQEYFLYSVYMIYDTIYSCAGWSAQEYIDKPSISIR